jgi:hypothetical protein
MPVNIIKLMTKRKNVYPVNIATSTGFTDIIAKLNRDFFVSSKDINYKHIFIPRKYQKNVGL